MKIPADSSIRRHMVFPPPLFGVEYIPMADQRILERVCIPTGNACNNRCAFCMEHPRRILPMPSEELLLAQLEKYHSMETIIFTAGEPLLNRDLEKWARYARDAGFTRLCTVSNGRLLADPARCRSLVESGINDFTVSIHGPDSATHDSLTGVPGSFEQTLAGLRNLAGLSREFDFDVHSSTVLTSVNHRRVADMIRLLAPLRLESITFKPPRIAGRAKRNVERIVVPLSDAAREFRRAISDTCREDFRLFPAQLILIADMPRCLLRDVEMLSGEYEAPVFADRSELKAERITSMAPHRQYPECRGCAFAKDCTGVEKAYVSRFGRDFIKPRKRLPAHIRKLFYSPPARIRSGIGRPGDGAAERRSIAADIERRIEKLSRNTGARRGIQAAESLDIGRGLLRLGRPARALDFLRIASRLSPSAPAAAALAIAHLSLNDIPSSQEALGTAATLRGGAPPLPEEDCLALWFRWRDSFLK